MTISERITQDITAAMKAREEHRLSTLRMVKSALKNKEIDKRGPLDDQEAMAILNTLIKQRKDSIEQFTKGGRKELADKEAAEITMIEGYLPKAAGASPSRSTTTTPVVRSTISEMGSPTMKDMGTVMKNAMAKFAASGTRVDGKVVSETVKKLLSGG